MDDLVEGFMLLRLLDFFLHGKLSHGSLSPGMWGGASKRNHLFSGPLHLGTVRIKSLVYDRGYSEYLLSND